MTFVKGTANDKMRAAIKMTTAIGGRRVWVGALLASLALVVAGPPVPVVRAQVPSNPVAHCRSIGTQDKPPGGSAAPAWMIGGAQVTNANYGATWRCSGGYVLVCGVQDMHSVMCSSRDRRRQPDSTASAEFCRDYPDSDSIPYAAGNRLSVFDWRCRGRVPTIISRFLPEADLDARGFVRSEWKALLPTADQARRYVSPVPAVGNVHGFFDPRYLKSENRQHLGADLPAAADAEVMAPVTGVVVVNNTSVADVGAAYITIKEAGTSTEHVLGHIKSGYDAGSEVRAGGYIGTVRPWPGNSHVHWGINRKGVRAASTASPQGPWGWGRAPAAATEAQAAARGWANPLANGAILAH